MRHIRLIALCVCLGTSAVSAERVREDIGPWQLTLDSETGDLACRYDPWGTLAILALDEWAAQKRASASLRKLDDTAAVARWGALELKCSASDDKRGLLVSARTAGPDLGLRPSGALVAPPGAFPCRLSAQNSPRVVQMRLGKAVSRLCNAVFHPASDTAVEIVGDHLGLTAPGTEPLTWRWRAAAWRASGKAQEVLRLRVHPAWYRETQKLPYFKPLDKSVFKLPPSGWCSWYYYYQGITEAETVKNAEWIARHLKPFGAEYVQIDDGWQGRGHGSGDNRDWNRWPADKFPHDMKWLASQIRQRGLKAGIWLTPFGQSDLEFVKRRPGAFMLKPDGAYVDGTWEGRYLVDATAPEGREYLQWLFRRLGEDWGYEYFKIDGQPLVINHYRDNRGFFRRKNADPVEAYRDGLRAIREAIGPHRFLLGCWGCPTAGIGIMNGSRTGGDVGAHWKGAITALQATQRWYFTHNIAWYADPDVLNVRPPLTLPQARAWATLLGLTGQLLMASDKMYDLPEDRVEVLRRVFPATDIQPLDLFPRTDRPPIWDLKVANAAGQFDVVAFYNWQRRPYRAAVTWTDLGLPPDQPHIAYDFWDKRVVGVFEDGFNLLIPPTSCRAYILRPYNHRPQLLATSRHIAQGAVDLVQCAWDRGGRRLSGRSRVVGGDPYAVTVSLPPGWRLTGGQAGDLPCRITQDRYAGSLSFMRPTSGEVAWSLTVGPGQTPPRPPAPAIALETEVARQDRIGLSWKEVPGALGYVVRRDGKRLGVTTDLRAEDGGLKADTEYSYQVAAYDWEGEFAAGAPVTAKTLPPPEPPPPPDVFITVLKPKKHSQQWGELHFDRSVEGKPLSIKGHKYEHGIGTHAHSEIVYELDGSYKRFVAWGGIDDEKRHDKTASIVFEVYLDGKKVFESPVVRADQEPTPINVPLGQARELKLVVSDAEDGINCDHADWVEAGFVR